MPKTITSTTNAIRSARDPARWSVVGRSGSAGIRRAAQSRGARSDSRQQVLRLPRRGRIRDGVRRRGFSGGRFVAAVCEHELQSRRASSFATGAAASTAAGGPERFDRRSGATLAGQSRGRRGDRRRRVQLVPRQACSHPAASTRAAVAAGAAAAAAARWQSLQDAAGAAAGAAGSRWCGAAWRRSGCDDSLRRRNDSRSRCSGGRGTVFGDHAQLRDGKAVIGSAGTRGSRLLCAR